MENDNPRTSCLPSGRRQRSTYTTPTRRSLRQRISKPGNYINDRPRVEEVTPQSITQGAINYSTRTTPISRHYNRREINQTHAKYDDLSQNVRPINMNIEELTHVDDCLTENSNCYCDMISNGKLLFPCLGT